MKRWSIALMVLALVAAACGGDDSGGTESNAAATTAGTGTVATDTTQPDARTPASTTTAATTTAAAGSVGDLAITEVVFGDHVTVTNLGTSTVSIDELWLCNRPSYKSFSVDLAPGESQTVDAGSVGGLAAGSGEVALYTSSDFGDSGAITDYVSWGGGGGRGSVATGAGIWPDGDTVTGGGTAINAPNGGDSSADWSSQ